MSGYQQKIERTNEKKKSTVLLGVAGREGKNPSLSFFYIKVTLAENLAQKKIGKHNMVNKGTVELTF